MGIADVDPWTLASRGRILLHHYLHGVCNVQTLASASRAVVCVRGFDDPGSWSHARPGEQEFSMLYAFIIQLDCNHPSRTPVTQVGLRQF